MLKALYDYALRMNLTQPAGYADKPIKAFLCLTKEGRFVGLRADGENLFRCPHIGSIANGPDKSNLLVEKYSIIFPEGPSPKSQFFREGLKDFGKQEPLAEICFQALENPECCTEMIAALEQHKIKKSDRISFMVGSAYLVECSSVQTWWQTYRLQFQKPVKPEETSLCLITGQPTSPMSTVPKNTGLSVVGGHSSGDALICFDKNSFCSYGLKQSANAPVSEEAFAQVQIALDSLLKDAPILAGMKFVHWYDKPLPRPELNLFTPILGDFVPDEYQEYEADEPEEVPYAEQAQQAQQEANRLVQSVETGQAVLDLPNRYYILLLSGVNGRVMIRQFFQGSYAELKANLDQWYADLQLTNSAGTANLKPFKMTARFIRLLKYQSKDKKVFDRMEKELPGLTQGIFYGILQGTRLPESIAVRSLSYIRSQMFADTSEDNSPIVPDAIACQWLKIWLIRNYKEEALMPEYNPNHPSPAYHIGAMVAVYAALQQNAYPDVNVTVVQRFFASAQQTPALVLGRLAKMSAHHLAKLENPAAKAYEKRLAETGARIGDNVPTVLNLPEQSLFALGYYQKSAALIKERREQSAQKNNTNGKNEEE